MGRVPWEQGKDMWVMFRGWGGYTALDISGAAMREDLKFTVFVHETKDLAGRKSAGLTYRKAGIREGESYKLFGKTFVSVCSIRQGSQVAFVTIAQGRVQAKSNCDLPHVPLASGAATTPTTMTTTTT